MPHNKLRTTSRRQKGRTEITEGRNQIKKRTFREDGSIGTTTASVGRNFANQTRFLESQGTSRPGDLVGRNIPEFGRKVQGENIQRIKDQIQQEKLVKDQEIQRIINTPEADELRAQGFSDQEIPGILGGALSVLSGSGTQQAAESQGAGLATGEGAASLGAAGLAAGIGKTVGAAATKATITATKTSISRVPKTIVRQRSIVGKPADSGVDKIFHKSKAVAARYPSNAKSQSVTKGWLLGLGLTAYAANQLVDAYGTYPWAAHNNREAGDTLTFGMRSALNAGNIEQYDILAAEFDLMAENMPKVWEELPYDNVIDSSVRGFNNAKLVKNSMDVERLQLQGGN